MSNPEEKTFIEKLCYHEAGHALMYYLRPGYQDIVGVVAFDDRDAEEEGVSAPGRGRPSKEDVLVEILSSLPDDIDVDPQQQEVAEAGKLGFFSQIFHGDMDGGGGVSLATRCPLEDADKYQIANEILAVAAGCAAVSIAYKETSSLNLFAMSIYDIDEFDYYINLYLEKYGEPASQDEVFEIFSPKENSNQPVSDTARLREAFDYFAEKTEPLFKADIRNFMLLTALTHASSILANHRDALDALAGALLEETYLSAERIAEVVDPFIKPDVAPENGL